MSPASSAFGVEDAERPKQVFYLTLVTPRTTGAETDVAPLSVRLAGAGQAAPRVPYPGP